MVIIFFLLFFIPVCFAEDSGWNVAVETATNSVVELNYGASGLTLGGVGYLTKTGLPTRDIYHGLTPLKWVDGNANANIDDGEIVIKTPSEIALDKLASTRKESKNIVDAINATSTFERAFILVLLDEINLIRSKLVPALPARTITQLKTAIKNKIDSGDAD